MALIDSPFPRKGREEKEKASGIFPAHLKLLAYLLRVLVVASPGSIFHKLPSGLGQKAVSWKKRCENVLDARVKWVDRIARAQRQCQKTSLVVGI